MSRIAPRQLDAALARLTSDLAPATTLARVQRAWDSPQSQGGHHVDDGRPAAPYMPATAH